jgi:hypothetical protein
MTLSLTCACGVHLEIDATFAGQTITCPDCQRSLRVPAPNEAPRRTSGLAIASLVLALAGAFTLLGTLLAVLLGGLALGQIKRDRDRLAGRGLAIAGMVLGVILTGVSLFAYSPVELFGVDSLLRESQWAGKLEYSGPLEVSGDGFVIKRPSEEWGVRRPDSSRKTTQRQDAVPQSLLLVNVKAGGYIACLPVAVSDNATLEDCRKKAEEELARLDLASGGRQLFGLRSRVEVRSTRTLDPSGDADRVEMLVVKRVRRQDQTFVVRVVKKKQEGLMYIVAGGGHSNRFPRLEGAVHEAMDSFRLIDRNLPKEMQPNW